MEVVGSGADTVCMTPCFDAHSAVLAVKDPLLPLLQGDSRFDFGDCCSEVSHDETPDYSVCFTLTECFERCTGIQFTRQSVLYTGIWSLVYHLFWTYGRHGLLSGYKNILKTGNISMG